jgi:hypothetical protein
MVHLDQTVIDFVIVKAIPVTNEQVCVLRVVYQDGWDQNVIWVSVLYYVSVYMD